MRELSVTSEPRDSRGSRLSRARAVVRGYLVLSRLSYAFRYLEISYLRVPYFFSLRDLLVVKIKYKILHFGLPYDFRLFLTYT